MYTGGLCTGKRKTSWGLGSDMTSSPSCLGQNFAQFGRHRTFLVENNATFSRKTDVQQSQFGINFRTNFRLVYRMGGPLATTLPLFAYYFRGFENWFSSDIISVVRELHYAVRFAVDFMSINVTSCAPWCATNAQHIRASGVVCLGRATIYYIE